MLFRKIKNLILDSPIVGEFTFLKVLKSAYQLHQMKRETETVFKPYHNYQLDVHLMELQYAGQKLQQFIPEYGIEYVLEEFDQILSNCCHEAFVLLYNDFTIEKDSRLKTYVLWAMHIQFKKRFNKSPISIDDENIIGYPQMVYYSPDIGDYFHLDLN